MRPLLLFTDQAGATAGLPLPHAQQVSSGRARRGGPSVSPGCGHELTRLCRVC
jgi:hypothetical protein